MSWKDLALQIISHFEGCKLKSYWDSTGKVWTIGWGTTGPSIKSDTVWTQHQADKALSDKVDEFASMVDKAVRVPLTDYQKAALVSFCYNVGPGLKGYKDGLITLRNGNPSTLLKRVNEKDFSNAALEFNKWVKSGGVTLNGLIKRRKAETLLFEGKNWK